MSDVLSKLLSPDRLRSKWNESAPPPPPDPTVLDDGRGDLLGRLRALCATRYPAPRGEGLQRMLDVLEYHLAGIERTRRAGGTPTAGELGEVSALIAAVADVCDALELGAQT